MAAALHDSPSASFSQRVSFSKAGIHKTSGLGNLASPQHRCVMKNRAKEMYKSGKFENNTVDLPIFVC
jgi:hypothetical protein